MASLGDLLSGALGGEYSMGRPIDEEERRRIEELRAQGVYVPQERKVSPFRYGAGTVSKRNLANIRGAIQPEQKRRLEEYLARAGEQERQRMAGETRTRAMGFAVKDQARLADLKRRQGQPWTPDSGQSFKEHLQGGLAAPSLSDTERAELTVRQRGLLPYRQQEAALTKTEQEVATGAAKLPTTKLEEASKQDALRLAAEVRKLLPPDFANILAENTALGSQLINELEKSKLRVAQSREGQALLQTTTNQALAKAQLDVAALEDFKNWLNTPEGQDFAAQGNLHGLNIRDTLNTMQTRLLQASRMGGISGGLGDVLPPDFYGNRPRRQAGGRPTGIQYEADEELGGQPARLTPPVSRSSRPPTQTPRVPMRRGERRVRQTQPQPTPTPVAPVTSPAQQVPTTAADAAARIPPWMEPALRRGGATADKQAIYRKRDSLVSKIDSITDIFRREGRTQPRFQLDIERLAAIKAELGSLIAAYPWLRE
jgi:hypothetical protein